MSKQHQKRARGENSAAGINNEFAAKGSFVKAKRDKVGEEEEEEFQTEVIDPNIIYTEEEEFEEEGPLYTLKRRNLRKRQNL